MVFSSLPFLFLFLPAALLGYFFVNNRLKNIFLLLISLAFYAWGEPKFVIVMIGSILVNYATALVIEKRKERSRKSARLALTVGIAINIGILFVFKYLNFFTLNIHKMFSSVAITDIALPIGISFFTFQAVSYIIDVYRSPDIRADQNPINIGLYISFFPQLIAGPIVRYRTIAQQIKERSISWDGFCAGIRVFLTGLFKKILIANNVAILADKAFGTPAATVSVGFIWLGALAYTFQIYFDFSGYSDMAIGLGRMFGFQFDKNFNYPYIARSVTDFWRRWHISLGTWFRDYVYIPLGGSRVTSVWTHVRNLFLVWLLTGIWHGASWNFIAWGLMYFVLLIIEKYVVCPERFKRRSPLSWLWRGVTLIMVVLGWVLFRADGLRGGIGFIGAMFGAYGNPVIDPNVVYYAREYMILLIAAAILSTPVLPRWVQKTTARMNPLVMEVLSAAVYFGLFLFSISYLVMGAHNPFIYFNF